MNKKNLKDLIHSKYAKEIKVDFSKFNDQEIMKMTQKIFLENPNKQSFKTYYSLLKYLKPKSLPILQNYYFKYIDLNLFLKYKLNKAFKVIFLLYFLIFFWKAVFFLQIENYFDHFAMIDLKPQKNITVNLSDIKGLDQFKNELKQLINFLKNPKPYQQIGARLTKGILFVGPPGTGKTKIAKALAGQSNCAFYYKSGSQLQSRIVGIGGVKVRKLFQQARKNQPAIIFIDQFDSIGKKRNPYFSSFSRDTINQILSSMDGFQSNSRVVVIAATNHEQSLDPAIKRPGRFDKIINIPIPTRKDRQQIFQYYLNTIRYNKQSINNKILADLCIGFTGAEIKNLVNLAIFNAVKKKKNKANRQDFQYALDRVKIGTTKKTNDYLEQQKLAIAYHELGHAFTTMILNGINKVHKVTIKSIGNTQGLTSILPNIDRNNIKKKQLIDQIDIALGGRVAQQIFLGKQNIRQGCKNDLSKATDIAYIIVKKLGMTENSNLLAFDEKDPDISQKFKSQIAQYVNNLLLKQYKKVYNLLFEIKDQIYLAAKKLIQKEALTGQELKKYINISF